MRPIILSTLLLLLLVLSACGGSAPPQETPSEASATPATEPTTAPDDATPTSEATEEPSEEATPTAEATEEATMTPEPMPNPDAESNLFVGPLVMIQLSAQTGIDIEEMEIISTEAVEWPNSALGCPEAGQMYADMIVPGYRLLIEAQGETFDVGTDEAVSRIALCDKDLD